MSGKAEVDAVKAAVSTVAQEYNGDMPDAGTLARIAFYRLYSRHATNADVTEVARIRYHARLQLNGTTPAAWGGKREGAGMRRKEAGTGGERMTPKEYLQQPGVMSPKREAQGMADGLKFAAHMTSYTAQQLIQHGRYLADLHPDDPDWGRGYLNGCTIAAQQRG